MSTQRQRKNRSRVASKKEGLKEEERKAYDMVAEIRQDWTPEEVMGFCEKCNWHPDEINQALSNALGA